MLKPQIHKIPEYIFYNMIQINQSRSRLDTGQMIIAIIIWPVSKLIPDCNVIIKIINCVYCVNIILV
jgi:hypothetical protein